MADTDGPDNVSRKDSNSSSSASPSSTPIAGAMQGIAESTATHESSAVDATTQSVSTHDSGNRSELLNRARTFLTSPGVVNEAPEAKRRFLAEKGLTSEEVDALLHELVRLLYPSKT